jgi:hypothetical protein
MFMFITYPVQLHELTVHNFPHNMQVWLKIYWGFYHGILHIAYKGRHIRITYIAHSYKTCATSLAWTAYSSYGNTWVQSKVSGVGVVLIFSFLWSILICCGRYIVCHSSNYGQFGISKLVFLNNWPLHISFFCHCIVFRSSNHGQFSMYKLVLKHNTVALSITHSLHGMSLMSLITKHQLIVE